ncbi:MAG: DUF4405 domain-containing protein [Geminicoccaceae bacterium]
MSALKSTVTRDVVTPTTMVLFVVSTVTGVMLLFHWYGGLVHFSHEWLSVAFSAIAIWHLVKNWRTFTMYFRRSPAMWALATSLALSLVFTGLTGSTSERGGPGGVLNALADAPLQSVAPVFGMTPDAAAERLRAAGVEAFTTDTLRAIGARNGRNGPEIAMLLATTPR